jgi:hypothetical protein
VRTLYALLKRARAAIVKVLNTGVIVASPQSRDDPVVPWPIDGGWW